MNVVTSQTTQARNINVVLVDPSLFTGPYDAALTCGLLAAAVKPVWITRPTRPGDRQEIPVACVDEFFYRRTDRFAALPSVLRAIVKGVAHGAGLCKLVGRVIRQRPDLVHFQWTVIPLLDCLAFMALRRMCPVVLTVHDTIPFNGERLSWLQMLGLTLPMRLANRVIVHTVNGRNTLISRGVPAASVVVIPHGALPLHAVPSPTAMARTALRDQRWTFVMFGEIKPYKGVDVFIEALALLPPELQRQTRVIIAGRPRMDMTPLTARIAACGLDDVIELRPWRLSEQEMADLFASTDCFVFPYRQIDASGVYFLVRSLGKWLIASRVGVFAEELNNTRDGQLVAAEDSAALAAALADAITRRPAGTPASHDASWVRIGQLTRACYDAAISQHRHSPLTLRLPASASVSVPISPFRHQPQFALVTPSYRNDLELAKDLCRSIDLHVTGNYEHILIVPESDLTLFKPLESAHRRVVSEKQLLAPYGLMRLPLPTQLHLPFCKPVRFRQQWWCRGVGRISGWVTQQIIKLSVSDLTTAPFLVFVDSDVLFIRDLDTSTLLAPSGAPYLHQAEMPSSLTEHQEWYRTAQRLLALPTDFRPRHNYVGNLIVWRTDLVKQLHARISETQHEPWQRAVARTRRFSEYILYGVFAYAADAQAAAVAESEDDHSVRHLFRPSPLTCSIWTSSKELLAADVVNTILPEHVALHLQSTLPLPIHQRRGLCMQICQQLATPATLSAVEA